MIEQAPLFERNDAELAAALAALFPPSDTPIVLSYGAGTNSVAMLALLKLIGQRPALIMFADTGDEKPETYAHIEVMQEWCRANGFPPITTVRNQLPQGIKDGSLSAECMRLGTMPSKVFGRSNCSQKWKIEPQYQYLKRWLTENSVPFVRHWVGFDADEAHCADAPVPHRAFEVCEYPLVAAGWGREECIDAIDKEGIPRPGKSACFHCPSSKKPEVRWLQATHPDLYARALAMERRALAGEGQAPAARVKGLGRHWNWATFDGSDAGTPEPCGVCMDGSFDPGDFELVVQEGQS